MTELSSEGLDARRRRLLFRCRHRGIREMDFVLGRFADAQLTALGELLCPGEVLLAHGETTLRSSGVGAVQRGDEVFDCFAHGISVGPRRRSGRGAHTHEEVVDVGQVLAHAALRGIRGIRMP